MQAEDWKKGADGNFVFDRDLTASNATTQLKEGETYVGTSATVTSGTKNKDSTVNPETVNILNDDGSVTDQKSGVTFWDGASTRNASGSTITSKKEELDLGGVDFVNFNISVGDLIS